MEEKTIAKGQVKKTFIITMIGTLGYVVNEVALTEYDFRDNALESYEIDKDEKYSLFTSSSYVGERGVWDIEVGEILEINPKATIMRVA